MPLPGNKMAKLFNKKMYVYDPHDAIFSLMEHQQEIPLITEGKTKQFRFKSVIFLVLLLIARAGAIDYIPKFLDYILILVAGFLSVEVLIRIFRILNRRVTQEGLPGITKSLGVLFLVIVILAGFV